MALTGEEKGLMGSKWYAEHPLIPLRQTVFDFDCDGAGYNDKTLATIIGLERTSAEADIIKACTAFGLKAGEILHLSKICMSAPTITILQEKAFRRLTSLQALNHSTQK